MNGKTFEIHSGETILYTRFWGDEASIKLLQRTNIILSETLLPGCTVINLSENKNILIENLTYERNMPLGIELSPYGDASPDITIYGVGLYNIGSDYENIYGFDEFPESSERNFTGDISHSSYKLEVVSKE
ncbi:MAG: hypothetical protein P8P74_10645 [Crocinitomicaceae bacterium]|nr:hypothetical protein [Crocinitomicaceae bacterium]